MQNIAVLFRQTYSVLAMPTVPVTALVVMFTFTLMLNILGADASAAEYDSVYIKGIGHVRQKPDFCGEACAEMFLKKLGYSVDQDFVFEQSGLDPLLGRGCYTRDLVIALRKIGFDIGSVWGKVDASAPSGGLADQFKALHGNLKRGVPSIVCTRFNFDPKTTEHFRLVIGYDSAKDEIIYHDPAIDNGSNLRMSRADFFKLWPLKYDSRQWTIVTMPLKDVSVKTFVDMKLKEDQTKTSKHSDADFAQHILELKEKLPEGFHFVIQKPFVVIGNESKELVKKRAVQTVKWAVDRIKAQYFAKDPDEIIDVWLFKDKDSYESNCQKLFKMDPGTPFGFYSPRWNALVMNISTGGGTLVHEIVHPFMASNFEACPSWFNEGLASLYEQSMDRNGKIAGATNWRLRGLQLAIDDGRVPSFKTLTSSSTDEFYNKDKGTNYAQARYLCYYLQERGLLNQYYHRFVRDSKSDPTGYETLQAVLKTKDMDRFKKEWEEYVLKLRF